MLEHIVDSLDLPDSQEAESGGPMTNIQRAYSAISRAYRLHLPAPEWAIELLEKRTDKIEQNIVETLEKLKPFSVNTNLEER